MPDVTVKTKTYSAVDLPATACKMQVHGVPVSVKFDGTVSKGIRLEVGDVIPIRAGQTMQARVHGDMGAVLTFQDFG